MRMRPLDLTSKFEMMDICQLPKRVFVSRKLIGCYTARIRYQEERMRGLVDKRRAGILTRPGFTGILTVVCSPVLNEVTVEFSSTASMQKSSRQSCRLGSSSLSHFS